MREVKYIITVITFLFIYNLIGQQRFNKIYINGEDSPELLVLDSGYVTMVQKNLDWNRLVIREYDLLGNIVDSNSYLFDTYIGNFTDCLYQIPNTQKFVYAMVYGRYTMLIKFNRQWDTLYTREYRFQDSLGIHAYYLLPEGDSSFVLTGNVFDSITQKNSLLLARFDTAFNLISENHYEDPRPTGGGYYGFHILPVNDGYLIGGSSFYPGGQILNEGIIAKTDRQGNFDWFKVLASSKDRIGAQRLGKRDDGDYFGVGPQVLDTVISNISDPYRLKYVVFRTDGTIVKDTFIGPLMNRFGSEIFMKNNDDSYVMGGQTFTDKGLNSHLFKFNEDGDSLWQRFYYHGYPEAVSHLYNLKLTPDSGYIMAGYFLDVEQRYGGPVTNYTWLLKVDQYGCVTAGCEQIGLPEGRTASKAFQLYPNPARGELSISANPEANTALELELYSLQGQKVWQQPVELPVRLRLPDLPGATYLLLLKEEGRVVQRERFQILR